jgi:HK97 family phage portal protein
VGGARGGVGAPGETEVGGVLMGLRSALAMFRQAEMWPGVIEATPPGALRPSSTFWFNPAGGQPPVTWAPGTGEFETHWDWSRSSLLSIPGVWKARMLISQSIGGMPLAAYRGTEIVEPLAALLREPAPGEDRANTVAAWVCDLLDHGNAIGIVDGYDAEGRAVSLSPVPCSQVEIRSESGRRNYRIGSRVFDQSQVFHAMGTTAPGAIRGMGVIEAHLTTLTRMTAEADYASKAFTSGVPSGLIRVKDPDLQPEMAAEIKATWMKTFGSGREPAVLSELVDFEPIAWTPSDAQMVEARQLSLTDVANMYNLDPFWLGAPSAPMVYQNVQQAAVQLSRFTLGFWTTVLEAQFSRLIPRGQDARFIRDTILRDDTAARYANYKLGLEGGWLTLEEVRAAEGLPALPEEPPKPVLVPVPLTADGDQGANAPVNIRVKGSLDPEQVARQIQRIMRGA